MAQYKVLLHGLKPNDIIYSTNPELSVIRDESRRGQSSSTQPSSNQEDITPMQETDYLDLYIKPIEKPNNQHSLLQSDVPETTPICVTIRQTSRGTRRIWISQTSLLSQNINV
ncbi:unnamed protein product [Adineta ricciae]|uniref:Uncharacterized protein n=1 Tax=Adineta ricciae TaxID=249248 RepID=A0A814D6Y9_ADIRI|nr:unnamed protein product [Adineta ricciae]